MTGLNATGRQCQLFRSCLGRDETEPEEQATLFRMAKSPGWYHFQKLPETVGKCCESNADMPTFEYADSPEMCMETCRLLSPCFFLTYSPSDRECTFCSSCNVTNEGGDASRYVSFRRSTHGETRPVEGGVAKPKLVSIHRP